MAADGMIPLNQAALLLMLSGKRIRQLARDGYMPSPVDGRVGLIPTVQGYLKFLQDPTRRAARTAEDARVQNARAQQIEARNLRTELEMIPTDEARAFLERSTGLLLSRLAELPAQLYPHDPDSRARLAAMIQDISAETARNITEGDTDDDD